MKKRIITPRSQKLLTKMGENIKRARRRRKMTTIQMAELAGISRTTLYLVEKGETGVAFGAYFNVLSVLGLQHDFLKLADEDILGKKS